MKRRQISLLVLFMFCWLFVLFTQPTGGGSTFSASPEGAKAFFLFLESAGLTPVRWHYPFSDLRKEDTGGVLFLISPSSMGGENDLKQWVSAGNTAVIFGSAASSLHKLLIVLGLGEGKLSEVISGRSFDFLGLEEDLVQVNCPDQAGVTDAECTAVKQISRPFLPVTVREKSEVLAGNNNHAWLLRRRVGAGTVWLFSGSEPVWNQNIDAFDNLRLLYQLASAGKQIIFDEFHHGYVAPVPPANREGFKSLVLVLGYLGVVGVLIALSRGVRFGCPAPEGPQESLASTDFAGVLGLLYYERNAHSALKHYIASWRGRVEKRYGISRKVADEVLVTELAHEQTISPADVNHLLARLKLPAQLPSANPRDLEQAVSELERIFQEKH